jgi:hypothetical protein
MAKRDPADQSPAADAGHVRLCAGLIQENQPFRVKRALIILPFGAGLGDVRATLLGRVQSLF